MDLKKPFWPACLPGQFAMHYLLMEMQETLSFMLIIGIALHGICYDFFFVSGQIYTDAKAGIKYKSAAQGLITLATYGIGMLIGFEIAGLITDAYTTTHSKWCFNVYLIGK